MSSSMKLVTGALALGLSACALGTAERVPSLLDPSNPDAHESPMPAMLALHGSPPPAAPPAPPPTPPTDAGTPSAGLYVCPMHRDVTAHGEHDAGDALAGLEGDVGLRVERLDLRQQPRGCRPRVELGPPGGFVQKGGVTREL